jgi:hypothetical protein
MLKFGSSVRQLRCRVTEARAKSSTAATAPVKAESAKLSRRVERTMKRKYSNAGHVPKTTGAERYPARR